MSTRRGPACLLGLAVCLLCLVDPSAGQNPEALAERVVGAQLVVGTGKSMQLAGEAFQQFYEYLADEIPALEVIRGQRQEYPYFLFLDAEGFAIGRWEVKKGVQLSGYMQMLKRHGVTRHTPAPSWMPLGSRAKDVPVPTESVEDEGDE
eukprot:Hpha_TRINITY_DN37099_c0_g1::TRINITY_DN37099_c0_g1_i1::g.83125::m.83125